MNDFEYRNTPCMTGLLEDEHIIGVGDLDLDGDVEVIQVVDPPTQPALVTLFRHQNDQFISTDTTLGSVSINAFDVVDIDNDNDIDFLANGPSGGWGIYENAGGIDFSSFTQIGNETNFFDIFASDWDQGNDLDILTLNLRDFQGYSRESGSYVFNPNLSLLDESLSGRLRAGDYDNDGDLDFFVFGTHNTTLLRNQDGVFDRSFSGIPDKGIDQLALGDYDNDGDLDVGAAYSGQLHIYENRGGLYVFSQTFGRIGQPVDLEWGDVDNDGDLDLVGIDREEGVLFYNEDGHFRQRNNLFVAGFGGSVPQRLIFQDLDGDFDADMMYRNLVLRNRAEKINAPPSPPAELSVELLEGGTQARLLWSPSSDDTTPASALTYNLRIGTTVGGTDILSPMSILEGPKAGFRLRHGPGNMGTQREYLLRNVDPDATYYWSVQAQDHSGAGGTFAREIPFTSTGVLVNNEDERGELVFDLHQNYPNPFNPSTTLRFSIPEPVNVQVDVYDLLGRRVDRLVNRSLNPGYHEVRWEAGWHASGVYFARMQAGSFAKVVKMVLVK